MAAAPLRLTNPRGGVSTARALFGRQALPAATALLRQALALWPADIALLHEYGRMRMAAAGGSPGARWALANRLAVLGAALSGQPQHFSTRLDISRTFALVERERRLSFSLVPVRPAAFCRPVALPGRGGDLRLEPEPGVQALAGFADLSVSLAPPLRLGATAAIAASAEVRGLAPELAHDGDRPFELRDPGGLAFDLADVEYSNSLVPMLLLPGGRLVANDLPLWAVRRWHRLMMDPPAGLHAILPSALEQRAEAAVQVDAAGGDNYYHFLHAVAPRLRQAIRLWPDRALLAAQATAAQPFFRDLAAGAGIPASRILALPEGRYRHPAIGVIDGPHARIMAPETISWLRGCLGVPELPAGHRRLYVSRARAKRRSLLNDAAISRALAARGFETVFPEDLPMAAQAALFSQAAVVVAPHGAGLANAVFLPPGARVLELFAACYVNPCMWLLSASRGLRWAFAACPEVAPGGQARDDVYRNFRLAPETLLDYLDRLEAMP